MQKRGAMNVVYLIIFAVFVVLLLYLVVKTIMCRLMPNAMC
jgi:hypothetical protein